MFNKSVPCEHLGAHIIPDDVPIKSRSYPPPTPSRTCPSLVQDTSSKEIGSAFDVKEIQNEHLLDRVAPPCIGFGDSTWPHLSTSLALVPLNRSSLWIRINDSHLHIRLLGVERGRCASLISMYVYILCIATVQKSFIVLYSSQILLSMRPPNAYTP